MARKSRRNSGPGRVAVLVASLWAGALAAQDFTTFKGHGGPVMGLDVASSGAVASASFDNSVGLWNGGRPDWLEGHDAAVVAVAFGPEGKVLVSGGDDFSVRLWGRAPRLLGRHEAKVTSLAVSPDGDLVASGSWDGTIRLWSLDEGPDQTLDRPGTGVNDVAFSADGRTLYAATAGGTIFRYDLDTGAKLPLVRHGFGVNCLVVGKGWLAYGAVDGGTRVIDSGTGAEIADFTLERRPILAMDHHAGTGQIAVGDGHGFIMILDAAEWQISRDFRAVREGPIWALSFSPDGRVIHAGGLDDVIYAWPVALLDEFDPEQGGAQRSFLRDADSMPNGERQFMRKCSICHALEPGPSRKAGPTLYGLFGRPAGSVPGYSYSPILTGSEIVWTGETVDQLFDLGPDHFIPGSKMPMQVIAGDGDRADLIEYLETATRGE